jgi:hypothetical protein
MTRKSFLVIEVLCALMPLTAGAQSSTDMPVLKGLAPVTVLFNTPEGIATLAANYAVTGGIQTGAIRQSTLLPFAEQQQQALRDAFITSGNLAQLADGLGTTLGASYLARSHYVDQTNFASISKPVADVIAYAFASTAANSNTCKYFFANATTNGKTPVSGEAKAILTKIGGETDTFGKNYGFSCRDCRCRRIRRFAAVSNRTQHFANCRTRLFQFAR